MNYKLTCLPEIKLKSFDKFKATEYKVKIEKKIVEEKIKRNCKQNKQF